MKYANVMALSDSLLKVSVEENTVLAVDCSNFVYDMFVNEAFMTGFLEHWNKDINSIEVVDFLALRFLSLPAVRDLVAATQGGSKLKLIFVLDGNRPAAKLVTPARDKSASTALEAVLDAIAKADFQEALSVLPKCFRRTMELGVALRAGLLRLKNANISVLVAKEEADHVLAALCHEGKASAVVSADSDMVAHGAANILRPFGKNGLFKRYQVCTSSSFAYIWPHIHALD